MNRLAEFYRKEGSRLLSFIRKRTGSSEDAEEIFMDIFARSIEAPNVLKPVEDLAAWLYASARNRIIDLYRAKGRRNDREIPNGEEAIEAFFVDRGTDPSADFEKQIVREAIEAALEELPEEQRSVFIQNELEGRTFREIAEETGISINTLMARKRYAVLALRKRLGKLKNSIGTGGDK